MHYGKNNLNIRTSGERVHRRLVYMYLVNVPSVSTTYFNKIKPTSHLEKWPTLSLKILIRRQKRGEKFPRGQRVNSCFIFEITDNIDPTIDVCPASRTFDLETSEDFVEVTFGAPGYFAGGLTSDSGGIKNTFFLPPSENFTINDLNQVRQVEFVAEDYSNNRASCFFSVRVLRKYFEL